MRLIQNASKIKGKTAIVRAALDVRQISDSLRLERSLKTLKHLKRQKAKIVIIAHRGRPERPSQNLSLKFLAPYFKKNLDKDIVFLPDHHFTKSRKNIEKSPDGSIFLLENLRFSKDEERNEPHFAHQLASLGDFYVNDAFSVSHRAHASVDAITKYLPSFAGFDLQNELRELRSIIRSPKKPMTLILGGGKALDKFSVIEKLYPNVQHILLGGILGNTFLRAQGLHMHPESIDGKVLPKAREWSSKRKIQIPPDLVWDTDGRALDIGPKTSEHYSKIIKKSKTIIWAGPMGMFEKARYRAGSEAIANAVAQNKGRSLVGGGETSTLLIQMGLDKKVGFLSTGGGAMLDFLAGKKLPGLEALK
ncbi:MAG: phosphoglycerate kinase [Candidatus Harrisonbacteria bacterium CG10_big_fil_rev_8_21_14_0_10_44_23]|uniref:Phosphoglycerate kinase n=1 Tax=Candidatus Harrisonbacteria bacterium CG10_big_fil_rev_8_21_14_0_10_44_23 TaxID=1974585 RepID=A0A2H0USB8_9BACT|nr:MAG: phosphoglycerate kinase [Candidatus Harrisonbacteria bacterium CG10_big_fil_rev_8_21_14_0_10_44_23]